MAQQFFLIDGYNLLHAAGMGRDRYGPGDFERLRNRLLRTLAMRLDADERARTTIVFDAPFNDDPSSDRLQIFELMSVVYSPAGVDADTEIEQRIARHSSPKQLSVVSSDRRIKVAAERRRATAVSSEAYFLTIIDREPLAPEVPMETATNPTSLTHQTPSTASAVPPINSNPRPISSVSDKDWDTHIDQLEADLKSRRHRHD